MGILAGVCVEVRRSAAFTRIFYDTTVTLEVSGKKGEDVQGHQVPKGGPGWGGYAVVYFH